METRFPKPGTQAGLWREMGESPAAHSRSVLAPTLISTHKHLLWMSIWDQQSRALDFILHMKIQRLKKEGRGDGPLPSAPISTHLLRSHLWNMGKWTGEQLRFLLGHPF